jgi:type IV pilus assembly protein PilA
MTYLKNKKGFTLIEMLAVILILGVLMTVAIPNIISTLDKNKKDTFIKDAKLAIVAAEYTITRDTKLEFPDSNSTIVFPLSHLKNLGLRDSPFGTYYSLTRSFVAITKDPVGADSEYFYYVHLVACTDEKCHNTEDDSVEKNRGINLVRQDELDKPTKADLVVKGVDVKTEIYDAEKNQKTALMDELNRVRNVSDRITNVIVY